MCNRAPACCRRCSAFSRSRWICAGYRSGNVSGANVPGVPPQLELPRFCGQSSAWDPARCLLLEASPSGLVTMAWAERLALAGAGAGKWSRRRTNLFTTSATRAEPQRAQLGPTSLNCRVETPLTVDGASVRSFRRENVSLRKELRPDLCGLVVTFRVASWQPREESPAAEFSDLLSDCSNC